MNIKYFKTETLEGKKITSKYNSYGHYRFEIEEIKK